jgi:hypothetical protein
MIAFVTAHWADIASTVALVVIVGERIAAVTATPEDDKWFSWIHKALATVGLKFPEVK